MRFSENLSKNQLQDLDFFIITSIIKIKKMKKEKRICINLGEICEAMEDHSLDFEYYLDLKNGEVIIKSNFESDLDSDISNEIEYDFERYESIPNIGSSKTYRYMEMFVESVEDIKLKGKLTNVLNGKKPFRQFKNVLEDNPEKQILWYDVKDKLLKQEAKDWLDSLNIKYNPVENKRKSVEEQITGKQNQLNLAINSFVELSRGIENIIDIFLFGSLVKDKRIAKDFDLLVFIENNDCISRLAKIYRKVLGTYHVSPDVFVLTKNGDFLGNVCFRKSCPSLSVDCQVIGCGDIKYIRRYPDFNFNLKDISKDKMKQIYHNPKYNQSAIEEILK